MFACAAWELIGGLLAPNQFTYYHDTWLSVGAMFGVHWLGIAGVQRKSGLLVAAYVGVLIWLLSHGLLEWWLPYLFNMASPERVVHNVRVLEELEAFTVGGWPLWTGLGLAWGGRGCGGDVSHRRCLPFFTLVHRFHAVLVLPHT